MNIVTKYIMIEIYLSILLKTLMLQFDKNS